MLFRAAAFLRTYASRKVIITLSGLAVVLNVFFLSPSYQSLQKEAPGVGMPDLHLYYSSQEAYNIINAYGDAGRSIYTRFLLTTDILWPVIYALILSLLTFALLRQNGISTESRLQRLGLLPAGALLFDLIENVGMLGMIAAFPEQNPVMANIASISTTTKWSFIGLSMLTIITLTTRNWLISRKTKRLNK